jgi:hypothetical protein
LREPGEPGSLSFNTYISRLGKPADTYGAGIGL